MRPHLDRFPAGGNVVPFPLPRATRLSETARAAVRRVDYVEDSAHDRTGSIVTLALFVLSSAFNAALMLAAFGVRRGCGAAE